MPGNAFRLGLTGGIGSGKSTVSTLLAKMGATVIDADAISRAATGVGGSAIDLIRASFGPRILTANGAVDREQMRELVFSDHSAKLRLESIVHPLVGNEIARQAMDAERAMSPCIVFDIPLLVESGHWRTDLHRILVIDCQPETQIARVCARNGLTATEVQKILASQASRWQRLAIADAVIFNDGITIDDIEHQLQQIAPQFGL